MTKTLDLIPYLIVKRNQSNTNWFFSPVNQIIGTKLSVKNKNVTVKTKSYSRKDSDEYYVIDLCDKVLGLIGSRQHHFEFLLGDIGENGKKAKLPVDVYYQELNLVIENKEQQHTKAIKHFDKPDILTLSGVPRSEQRRIYDLRRSE